MMVRGHEKIDYKRFNDPKRNRFYASPMEIEHKTG